LDVHPQIAHWNGEELMENSPAVDDARICDTHHHFYYDKANARYTLHDFAADLTREKDITSTVYVECRQNYWTDRRPELAPVGETESVHKSTETFQGRVRIAAGIVSKADLTLGERVREVLEAHLAASERVRGIRYNVACHEDERVAFRACRHPRILADPTFRRGALELHALNLSLDLWAFHTQLSEVTDFARQFPGTVIVNHFGGPISSGPYEGHRQEVYGHWSRAMAELAHCPNVFVKIGGLAPLLVEWNGRAAKPSVEEVAVAMHPYFDHCLTHFGAERCMVESNFPVDGRVVEYSTLWAAFKTLAKGASADDRKALFHGAAARAYRLQS